MKANILIYAKSSMFFMFGVAAIVFALGAVVNNPVKADNPTAENSTGKIMMHQEAHERDGKSYKNILVWDTETGKSKMYYLSFSEGAYKASGAQLPSSPIY
jgi:hypothetical protein